MLQAQALNGGRVCAQGSAPWSSALTRCLSPAAEFKALNSTERGLWMFGARNCGVLQVPRAALG